MVQAQGNNFRCWVFFSITQLSSITSNLSLASCEISENLSQQNPHCYSSDLKFQIILKSDIDVFNCKVNIFKVVPSNL